MKSCAFPFRQSSITLQQRLAQLVGASVSTFINPFGLVADAKILTVGRSIIAVRQNGSTFFLVPSGLQIFTINRRPKKATVNRYSISMNSITRDPGPNVPTILNNRRIVQVGKDFLETTTNGTFIELIPLTNVTVIFRPASNRRRLTARKRIGRK